ncbi:MAG: PilN domain-containing protein [Candidatus Eremiobacteraeota bacterium]|nr:PilN domain-containing protein [Candidatus Eremiobacteraeota bacterium]
MAIKVDLLPTERKKFGFDPVIAIMIVLIAASVVVFYYFGIKLDKDIEVKRQEITRVEQDIQGLQSQLPIIDKLKKENQDIETQINTVKSLRYDPIRYSNLLDELSTLMPSNMWVSSISIEPGQAKVALSGTATEMPGIRPLESISGFMKNVQKSKYFRGATLSSTSRGTTSVNGTSYVSYSWGIDLTYDPKAAEQSSPGTSGPEKGPTGLNFMKSPAGLNLTKSPAGHNLTKGPTGINPKKGPTGFLTNAGKRS